MWVRFFFQVLGQGVRRGDDNDDVVITGICRAVIRG